MRPDRPSLEPLTVDDYLELEESSAVRHEFVGGHVYEMSGTSARHNQIVFNILRRLNALIAGTPCRVYFIDVKVRVSVDRIYYPDVIVVSTAHAQDAVLFESPCFIVEVTSPSTRRVDRGEKLEAYQKVTSLLGYLVVEQGRRHVTLYRREGSEWQPYDVVSSGNMRIPYVDGDLSLDDVYAGIEMPQRVREGDDEWADATW